MTVVQIFGIKGSSATRAAERFFKERNVAIQFVDLTKKPMAPGEIRRFVDKFGIAGLVDTEGKPYEKAGLKYMRLSEEEMLRRIESDPGLLRLPLVRRAKVLSLGSAPDTWKAMLAD